MNVNDEFAELRALFIISDFGFSTSTLFRRLDLTFGP